MLPVPGGFFVLPTAVSMKTYQVICPLRRRQISGRKSQEAPQMPSFRDKGPKERPEFTRNSSSCRPSCWGLGSGLSFYVLSIALTLRLLIAQSRSYSFSLSTRVSNILVLGAIGLEGVG